MNVKLLKRVRNHIRNDWKHFDMSNFTKKTDCGTTRCIFGWLIVLGNLDPYDFGVSKAIAGLDVNQFDRLTYCTRWPAQFQGKKDEWKPTKKQVLARIGHFIKTGGAE